jgi:hypothetical protein
MKLNWELLANKGKTSGLTRKRKKGAIDDIDYRCLFSSFHGKDK